MLKDTGNANAIRTLDLEEYNSLFLELVRHEIFAALIYQYENGFRGPARFNKALKPNRGLEADAQAVCAERIQNVVNALMWDVRVAKEMLFKDSKFGYSFTIRFHTIEKRAHRKGQIISEANGETES